MIDEKNPYSSETPEWQLWENMTSHSLRANAFAEDAIHQQTRSAECREKSALYKKALAKLAASDGSK